MRRSIHRRAFLTGSAAALAAYAPRWAKAEARWPDERQAGPFLCHADFALAPHQALLDELASLQDDLAEILGAKRPREPIHLFLFSQKTTYQAYLNQYFPRVPYRRALYIKARGPGMVFAFQGSEFAVDVRHESTHALLHAWLPKVPLWLDEGLAEYFEVPRQERSMQHPHHEVLRAMVASRQLPQLEQLESLEEVADMGREQYRDAWAWIHFLLHGSRGGYEELLNYLAELEGGGEAGALSDRLRRQLPDASARLAVHFHG